MRTLELAIWERAQTSALRHHCSHLLKRSLWPDASIRLRAAAQPSKSLGAYCSVTLSSTPITSRLWRMARPFRCYQRDANLCRGRVAIRRAPAGLWTRLRHGSHRGVGGHLVLGLAGFAESYLGGHRTGR